MILLAHSTYETVEIGLFDGTDVLYTHSLDKKVASALLIPSIDIVLQRAGVSIKECLYAIVNQGPGPFTTVRTVITTMNGLSFATRLPLIGLNALEVLIYEYDPTHTKN